MLPPSVTKLLLVGWVLLGTACGDATSSNGPIAVTIESQEHTVSEDGELELTARTILIRSVSLLGGAEDVSLVGPVTVDLSIREQGRPLRSSIPPGSYTGLRIELAPGAEGANTLDVDLDSVMTEESDGPDWDV